MIKFILNHIPRPVLQKMAGFAVPVMGFGYIGRGVQCPVCGARYRRFMPYGYVESRPNALCPRCLALERHRLLWLWLTRQTDMLTAAPTFLHIAPEVSLMRQFNKVYAGSVADRYVTADLESPLAKVKLDVQAIPFSDNTFEVIFCNHILEHVADDRLAMSEMYRVMRPGGWGVMLSPVDERRAVTFEDDTVTDPAERTRLFGQYDHRRVYGRDYTDRLRSVGWQVEALDYFAALTPAEQTLYALRPEPLYIVRKV
jgi:SAM-dependent methyltransferase